MKEHYLQECQCLTIFRKLKLLQVKKKTDGDRIRLRNRKQITDIIIREDAVESQNTKEICK